MTRWFAAFSILRVLPILRFTLPFLMTRLMCPPHPRRHPPPALYPCTPNPDFTYALTGAFTPGFNASRNKPAEIIAKYVDKVMRRAQGATSDTEYEVLLNAVLGLYRYTEDKDVFRTFYHRMLAKRPLLGKTASDDFEKEMLKKLKEGDFSLGDRADWVRL